MKRNFCLLFFIIFISSCYPIKTWHRSTFMFFNTVCELKMFGSYSLFSEAKTKVKRIFASIEDQFGPGESNLKPEHVKFLLKESLEIHKNTGGSFDLTIEPLKKAWGFLNGDHRIPTKEEIDNVMKNVGMERIRINKGEIFIPDQVELDWGGIAKGFGVDLASKKLMEMNVKRGFINAGGDIFCWGENPDGEEWKIGIQHPRKKGFLGILSLSDLGAATSGDYQRFFIKDGIRYHHIFNPETGYPARGKQSVTVMGPKVYLCDALSTALFVSKNPKKVLNNYPDYGAILVDEKGRITFCGKKYNVDLLKQYALLNLHGH